MSKRVEVLKETFQRSSRPAEKEKGKKVKDIGYDGIFKWKTGKLAWTDQSNKDNNNRVGLLLLLRFQLFTKGSCHTSTRNAFSRRII